MNALVDPALSPLLWMGVSLAIAAMAAQLSFAWVERAPVCDAPARWRWLLGSGLSLGTGIWSSHGLAASMHPVGFAVGYHAEDELMVWLLAVAASSAALGWSGVKHSRVPHWLPGSIGLGSVIVALQMMGVLASGWRPGIEWRAGPLLLAWLICLAGCPLAFGLFHSLRAKGHRVMAWLRPALGLLLGSVIVSSQYLVAAAATLPSQTASAFADEVPAAAMTALASLGSAVLLMALRGSLRRQVRAQTLRVRLGREQGMESLNDPLTGLPSRSLFKGTLTQAVAQADAGDQRLALLFINLDGFKPINQSLGQAGGDLVLRTVATRLRSLSQPHMTAHLGGDEFLMLLTGDPQPEDACDLASRLLALIAEPVNVARRKTSICCSIGVAMYPEHGAMSTLVSHASTAMRAAKAVGGASHVLFETHMANGSREQMELLRDLRVALERGQMELYYQPKIHAPSGEITGAEALMRWHHPKRGMVSPVVFIPIAERYGLIGALGQWVIDEACRQTRAWRDAGLRMRVAINLSVHQLRQADLADRIGAALRRHQINPDLITCELTESSAMDDTSVTMHVLGQLAKLGVHISIDDFGTGHSSLSLLRKLPAHELKIDRNFVLDLETSEDARKVAAAVINLAKSLDLKVVAEGVETEEQNRLLRDMGCDQLQGFLFAKPMSAKALALWAMDDVGPRAMNFRDSLFKATGTENA